MQLIRQPILGRWVRSRDSVRKQGLSVLSIYLPCWHLLMTVLFALFGGGEPGEGYSTEYANCVSSQISSAAGSRQQAAQTSSTLRGSETTIHSHSRESR